MPGCISEWNNTQCQPYSAVRVFSGKMARRENVRKILFIRVVLEDFSDFVEIGTV